MSHSIFFPMDNACLAGRILVGNTVWSRVALRLFRRHECRQMTKFCNGVTALEPLLSPPQAPIHEHISAGWIQHPVVPLPRLPLLSRDLHKALIQRQIVADGILPALLAVFSIIGKLVPDELADFREGETLGGRTFNSHCYESNVRVGGLGRFSSVLRTNHFHWGRLHRVIGGNAERNGRAGGG